MSVKLEFHEDDVLVVVDVQEDFMNGPLGNEDAQEIIGPMFDFINAFPGRKVFMKDTHHSNYLGTQEGRHLPIIHTRYGTPGWEIVEPIKRISDEMPGNVILKEAFGSDVLYNYMKTVKPRHAYFIGVKTGICVISNVVLTKTASPETVVHVIEPLCACVTPESHRTAIEAMRLLQVDIIEEIPGMLGTVSRTMDGEKPSKYVYAVTEEDVNGAGEDATEYVEFDTKLTRGQIKELEITLRGAKAAANSNGEDASTSDIVLDALAAFERNGNPEGTPRGSMVVDEIRF